MSRAGELLKVMGEAGNYKYYLLSGMAKAGGKEDITRLLHDAVVSGGNKYPTADSFSFKLKGNDVMAQIADGKIDLNNLSKYSPKEISFSNYLVG